EIAESGGSLRGRVAAGARQPIRMLNKVLMLLERPEELETNCAGLFQQRPRVKSNLQTAVIALDEIRARAEVKDHGQKIIHAENFRGAKLRAVFASALLQKPVAALQ